MFLPLHNTAQIKEVSYLVTFCISSLGPSKLIIRRVRPHLRGRSRKRGLGGAGVS